MKRCAFNALRSTLYALFFVLPFAWAEPVVKVVNGRVKEVRLTEQRLVVRLRHPATGIMEDLVLQIDERTGFRRGIRLKDLRPEDPVSVDYEEIPGKIPPHAVQVKRVALRGVPNEVRRVF